MSSKRCRPMRSISQQLTSASFPLTRSGGRIRFWEPVSGTLMQQGAWGQSVPLEWPGINHPHLVPPFILASDVPDLERCHEAVSVLDAAALDERRAPALDRRERGSSLTGLGIGVENPDRLDSEALPLGIEGIERLRRNDRRG